MEDEFDGCIDDKTCVYETVISGGYIKQEPCVTEDPLDSNNCYASIKDENFDDSIVIAQETGSMTDGTDHTICENETVVSGGYIQKEPCYTNKEQGNIHNYQDIKNENIDDVTVIAGETELMADYIDDKVCVYETLVNGGYIKPEPCVAKDQTGSINYGINITDRTVIAQETGLTTDTKESCLIRCEACGEEYDMYCLKCPMLNRIFESNKLNKINSVRYTLPNVDIRQTSYGVHIIALRTILKGVVFGPFEGFNSTKNGAALKWSLKKPSYIKDLKQLNWMQYIRRVKRSCYHNLIPFQYEDRLYYRSYHDINEGDELLACWDNDSEGNGNQDLEDGYWKPRVDEKLDDTYACLLCCIGYTTMSHLTAHNSRCPGKRDDKNFCKAIIQCPFCKIYLDEKEYWEYHMKRCCDRKTKAVPTIRRLSAGSSVTSEPFLNETVKSTSQGVHLVDNITVVAASCSREANTQTDTEPFIIEEKSPTNEEMEEALETELPKRRFAEPRSLSDIETLDVSSPRRAKLTLRMVVETAQRHAKKIRALQERRRYIKKKLHSLKDLINDLKERNLISESAAESLLVYVTI